MVVGVDRAIETAAVERFIGTGMAAADVAQVADRAMDAASNPEAIGTGR